MNSTVLRGFRDELTKIKEAGMLASAGRGIKELAHAGWHGVGANKTPWWGKALTAVGPAMELPGALAKEDASGKGRSRAERLTGVAGRAGAGLLLGGAVSKATAPLNPYVASGASLGANLLYGHHAQQAGESIATAPWALARKLKGSNPPARPDESWRNQSPVQSPPAREGRQELL